MSPACAMPSPRPPRYRWTEAERQVLRDHYEAEGPKACAARLPGRKANGIRQQAYKLGLKDPTLPRALRTELRGADLARAIALREQDGWSFARIAIEFDVCEASASNAVTAALCTRKGFVPARRDGTGALYPREIARMRALMLAGLKGIDIQLQMAVSAACVADHRRKFRAELKAQGKARLLPPPGGGLAYSGARIPAARKKEVERLLLTGLGTPKVAARTGVSKTHVQRQRLRLVRKLKRRGECLPGCDIAGRRLRQIDSARFIPAAAIAQLRQRLLDRWPVTRAARDLGIGLSSAYRIRDRLRAELAARGETLPAPVLPGRDLSERIKARQARWCPPGKIYLYRALAREVGEAEAKRRILAETAREKAAHVPTLEEQIEQLRNGARLVERPALRRALPDITLGGVATGMI